GWPDENMAETLLLRLGLNQRIVSLSSESSRVWGRAIAALFRRGDFDDLGNWQPRNVLQLLDGGPSRIGQAVHVGENGWDQDVAALAALAAHAEFQALLLLWSELADQVLGRPDRAIPGEIRNPRRVIQGVAEHRELDLAGRLQGAQPLLALVQAGVHVELGGPALAQLPLLAHAAHRFSHFLCGDERVPHMAAITLGEKVADHPVPGVLAVSAVVTPENRIDRHPDLVDQFEIFFGRQFGPDPGGVLQVRYQHRHLAQLGAALARERTGHKFAGNQQRRKVLGSAAARDMHEQDPFAKLHGVHAYRLRRCSIPWDQGL